MIKSFKCKETEKIFRREASKKLPHEIQKRALNKLLMLHAAVSVNSLRIPPANRLEQLQGNLSNLFSIRINDQWRICFEWRQNDAFDVEIVDYH